MLFLVDGPLRGGGGKTLLTTKQKNAFLSKERIYEIKIRPLRSRGGGYSDISGLTTKKNTFLCVSSLRNKHTNLRVGVQGRWCVEGINILFQTYRV